MTLGISIAPVVNARQLGKRSSRLATHRRRSKVLHLMTRLSHPLCLFASLNASNRSSVSRGMLSPCNFSQDRRMRGQVFRFVTLACAVVVAGGVIHAAPARA